MLLISWVQNNTNISRLMENRDGRSAVSPALKTGFKVLGKHASATQITRKDLEKPPLRGSHASSGGQR